MVARKKTKKIISPKTHLHPPSAAFQSAPQNLVFDMSSYGKLAYLNMAPCPSLESHVVPPKHTRIPPPPEVNVVAVALCISLPPPPPLNFPRERPWRRRREAGAPVVPPLHSSSVPVGQCCLSSQLFDASSHDVPQKKWFESWACVLPGDDATTMMTMMTMMAARRRIEATATTTAAGAGAEAEARRRLLEAPIIIPPNPPLLLPRPLPPDDAGVDFDAAPPPPPPPLSSSSSRVVILQNPSHSLSLPPAPSGVVVVLKKTIVLIPLLQQFIESVSCA